MHLTPAEAAIRAFGSRSTLAAAAGVERSTVMHWENAGHGRARRTAGDLPVPVIRRILAAAKATGIALDAHALIYGVDVADEPLPAAAV